MDDFNPAVFARQIALVAVGYMSGRGILPAEMSGPVVETASGAPATAFLRADTGD